MASDNFREKQRRVEEYLDQFDKKLGIALSFDPGDLNSLLDIDDDQLKTMSARECGEKAFLLSRYSLYIQKIYNEEKGKEKWCARQVDFLIAPILQEIYGVPYEERRPRAVLACPEAIELDRAQSQHEMKCQRLEWMANRIDSVVKVLLAIQSRKEL